jgi:hypothetical protein
VTATYIADAYSSSTKAGQEDPKANTQHGTAPRRGSPLKLQSSQLALPGLDPHPENCRNGGLCAHAVRSAQIAHCTARLLDVMHMKYSCTLLPSGIVLRESKSAAHATANRNSRCTRQFQAAWLSMHISHEGVASAVVATLIISAVANFRFFSCCCFPIKSVCMSSLGWENS